MTVFDLSGLQIGVKPTAARVWTSPNWATGFTYRPDMTPTQATWASGGDVSTASIEYRFGSVMIPGRAYFENYAEITARGYYVLIEWIGDDGSGYNWLGYAESPVTEERYHGDASTPAGGLQRIPCYGFERILSLSHITTTVHADPANSEGDPLRKFSGATFNADPERGNRSGEYFANPTDQAEHWTSRQIVDHLFKWHLPTKDGKPGVIPWQVDHTAGALPTWDRPTVETDGRTLADCLDDICDAERLLGWRVDYTVRPSGRLNYSPPSISAVRVVPYTLTASAVSLPGVGSVPANPLSHQITADADPLTDIEKSLDSLDAVDQVVIRGPREIAIGTLRHKYRDGDLENAWTGDDENAYSEAAKDVDLWAFEPLARQREMNQQIRDKDKLRDVFRLLRIKKDWNASDFFYQPDPQHGEGAAGGEDAEQGYTPYLGNVELLRELPLLSGINYSGPVDDVDEGEGTSKRPPLVLFESPTDQTVFREVFNQLSPVEGMPARVPEMPQLSVDVRPDNSRGPGLELKVNGGPRHAIAGPFFEGNEADVEQEVFAGVSFSTLAATVAIRGDRRATYVYPAAITPAPDFVRRRIIDIDHPSLQLVWIQPETVVEVDELGAQKKSDGGVLRDPFPLLQALATLAATRQTAPRWSVDMNTRRRLAIGPGSILQAVDGETVDAVVTETSITAEVTDQPDQMEITQRIKATTPGVDVLKLMGTAGDRL